MGTIIIFLVVFFVLKFIYDTYLTDNTEKDWIKYSAATPHDKLVKELALNSIHKTLGKIRFDGLYVCNRWLHNGSRITGNITTILIFNEDLKVAVKHYNGFRTLNLKSFLYMSDLLLQSKNRYIERLRIEYPINTEYYVDDGLVFFKFNYDMNSNSYTGTIFKDKISFGVVSELVDHHTLEKTLETDYNLDFIFYDKSTLKSNESYIFKPEVFKIRIDEQILIKYFTDYKSLETSFNDYNIDVADFYKKFNTLGENRSICEFRQNGIFSCRILTIDNDLQRYSISIYFDEKDNLSLHEHPYFILPKSIYQRQIEKFKTVKRDKNKFHFSKCIFEPNVIRFSREIDGKFFIFYEIFNIGKEILLKRKVYYFDSEYNDTQLISEWKDVLMDFYLIEDVSIKAESGSIRIDKVKYILNYDKMVRHDLL